MTKAPRQSCAYRSPVKPIGTAFPPDFKQDATKLTGIRANSGQTQRHCSFRRRDCLLGASDSGALPIHHGEPVW